MTLRPDYFRGDGSLPDLSVSRISGASHSHPTLTRIPPSPEAKRAVVCLFLTPTKSSATYSPSGTHRYLDGTRYPPSLPRTAEMQKSRPSSRAAYSHCPADTASRTSVLDTATPSTRTSSITVTSIPRGRQSSRRSTVSPLPPAPKL